MWHESSLKFGQQVSVLTHFKGFSWDEVHLIGIGCHSVGVSRPVLGPLPECISYHGDCCCLHLLHLVPLSAFYFSSFSFFFLLMLLSLGIATSVTTAFFVWLFTITMGIWLTTTRLLICLWKSPSIFVLSVLGLGDHILTSASQSPGLLSVQDYFESKNFQRNFHWNHNKSDNTFLKCPKV